ncbi:MAG: phenylacetate-CoA oxygenase subunit PaaJ [Gammaproteobacteria bacterium]|nr:phenylacetate-CoA oxygenase subunit PaaJ [Gammaproteobacteria bacterium]
MLNSVTDPEIPVLTIADLGILRDIEQDGDTIIVTVTPTYVGCPAVDTIADDIRAALNGAGYDAVEVRTRLAPTWTTDWLSEEGRRKLTEYGIAPPESASRDKRALMGESRIIACPRCKSTQTSLVSEFGSTACKALYRCEDCLEPFDYFKCL